VNDIWNTQTVQTTNLSVLSVGKYITKFKKNVFVVQQMSEELDKLADYQEKMPIKTSGKNSGDIVVRRVLKDADRKQKGIKDENGIIV